MEFLDGNNGLWGLFLSAFISSTLLPGGSEVILVLLVKQQQHPEWLLLLLATTGNTLGAITTWLVGVLINRKFIKGRELKPRQQRAVRHLQRWGSPVLLLSWLPLIGDALCLAAGILRVPFFTAVLFIAVGKCLRYYLVILASTSAV